MSEDTEDTRWELFEATQESSGNGQPATPSPNQVATEIQPDSKEPHSPEGQLGDKADAKTSPLSPETSTPTPVEATPPAEATLVEATPPTEATPTEAEAATPTAIEAAAEPATSAEPTKIPAEGTQATPTNSNVSTANPVEAVIHTQASQEKPAPKPKAKTQELGPLPAAMHSVMLTEDDIAERTRKNLYPIPFPIFSCLWPAEDLVFVGGGGGRPGTGISSGLVVCRRAKNANEYDLKCCADVDSQNYLVFQMALHPSHKEFIGAVGGRVYRFSFDDAKVSSLNYAQTDFHSEVAEQFTSCLRFNMAGDQVVTGGEDRTIRSWSYPGLELLQNVGSHPGPLTSVDFNKDGTLIVSTSSGGHSMRIWRADKSSSSPAHEVAHTLNGVKLEFRCCRWGLEKDGSESMVAILNAGPRGPSYLAKFSGSNFSLLKLHRVDTSPLGNLEMCPSRDFAALADNVGTVWVYDVATMTCVNKRKKCHNLPCTSLAWAQDGSMVCSASADKSVVFVPRVGERNDVRLWVADRKSVV